MATAARDPYLILVNDAPAGWPGRLEFDKRKDALAQANRIRAQYEGGVDVTVERESAYLARLKKESSER